MKNLDASQAVNTLGLPSKSPEEEEKHRQQYETMIEAAKRKEAKDVKLRKKQIEQQLRHEDELSAALGVWRNEILPGWETTKSCKKTRDLWWNGVPPSVRGQVWKLAIGNELNLTPGRL
ncbi:TBC1 domain family member 12 [Lamellibrachia satsuma]|nr:TBC1 domain family member 12 [Lamellibrachia satsuma]